MITSEIAFRLLFNMFVLPIPRSKAAQNLSTRSKAAQTNLVMIRWVASTDAPICVKLPKYALFLLKTCQFALNIPWHFIERNLEKDAELPQNRSFPDLRAGKRLI